MGGAVDVEPPVGRDFAFEDLVVDTVVEDFGAAAGEGAEAGVAKCKQYLADAKARDAGEVDDLDGGEGLDVQGRAGAADAAEHAEVVVELEPGVKAADDMDFGGAGIRGLSGGGEDLVDGHLVGAFFAAFAVEGAEFTGEGADVGVVDVAVAVVEGLFAVEAVADDAGQAADGVDVAGVVEGDAVVVGQLVVGEDLFGYGQQRGVGHKLRGAARHW